MVLLAQDRNQESHVLFRDRDPLGVAANRGPKTQVEDVRARLGKASRLGGGYADAFYVQLKRPERPDVPPSAVQPEELLHQLTGVLEPVRPLALRVLPVVDACHLQKRPKLKRNKRGPCEDHAPALDHAALCLRQGFRRVMDRARTR